VKVKWSLCKN